jgi:tRNA nucleotidyltransferase/poly(A) polymerase
MSALKEFLAENIRKLLNISQQEVYLVGGFVRERLLLNTTYDYDFIVKENSLEISKALAKESKGAFVLLDPERETGRVAWNIERNNFNLNFDIAKLVGGSIESDLRLRDITINAMAIRVTEDNIEKILDENYAFSKEEIVDFSNGFEDLKNKVIRTYRKENLIDDPLRMLRVFRFIGKFNFEVENETATFIKEKASLITKPAKERVLKELFDIFSYNNASKVLSNMQEVSLLDYLFMDLKLKSKELLTEGIAKVAELEEKNFVNSKATEVENYLAQTLTLEHTKLAVSIFVSTPLNELVYSQRSVFVSTPLNEPVP